MEAAAADVAAGADVATGTDGSGSDSGSAGGQGGEGTAEGAGEPQSAAAEATARKGTAGLGPDREGLEHREKVGGWVEQLLGSQLVGMDASRCSL